MQAITNSGKIDVHKTIGSVKSSVNSRQYTF